jgi:hypothetical protein
MRQEMPNGDVILPVHPLRQVLPYLVVQRQLSLFGEEHDAEGGKRLCEADLRWVRGSNSARQGHVFLFRLRRSGRGVRACPGERRRGTKAVNRAVRQLYFEDRDGINLCFQHPASGVTVEQWRQWYGTEPR